LAIIEDGAGAGTTCFPSDALEGQIRFKLLFLGEGMMAVEAKAE
jgi:hypothetical protein